MNQYIKMLKDIFVTYEIAQKFKEIGFDEPCIAGYYLCQGVHPMLNQMILNVGGNNGNYDISAPTYEQVKKWFREKGYKFSIISSVDIYSIIIEIGNDGTSFGNNYNTYEEAREQLILKLIEIYKDGK